MLPNGVVMAARNVSGCAIDFTDTSDLVRLTRSGHSAQMDETVGLGLTNKGPHRHIGCLRS